MEERKTNSRWAWVTVLGVAKVPKKSLEAAVSLVGALWHPYSDILSTPVLWLC